MTLHVIFVICYYFYKCKISYYHKETTSLLTVVTKLLVKIAHAMPRGLARFVVLLCITEHERA